MNHNAAFVNFRVGPGCWVGIYNGPRYAAYLSDEPAGWLFDRLPGAELTENGPYTLSFIATP